MRVLGSLASRTAKEGPRVSEPQTTPSCNRKLDCQDGAEAEAGNEAETEAGKEAEAGNELEAEAEAEAETEAGREAEAGNEGEAWNEAEAGNEVEPKRKICYMNRAALLIGRNNKFNKAVKAFQCMFSTIKNIEYICTLDAHCTSLPLTRRA